MIIPKQFLHGPVLAAGLLLTCSISLAAEIAAPYVPTAPSVVERMLDLAKVGADDFLIDLGSGDGRIVITAAKNYGASGFGVDIDPKLVALANANARAAGVQDRVHFYDRDLYATDLSQATVVTIYLLTRSTMKLESRLFDLKPGTRIVSHAGSMGEWRHDQFQMFEVKDKVRPDAPKMTYIYLWVVPAKVAGRWHWSIPLGARTHDYQLDAVQKYQNVSGTLGTGGGVIRIEAGKLDGDRITLDFNAEVEGRLLKHHLVGTVAGDSIVGSASVTGEGTQTQVEWKAMRAGTPGSHSVPADKTKR